MMKTKINFTLFLLFLGACQPTPEPIVPLPNHTPPVEIQAKLDMINFFVYLNHAEYEQAVNLYGGSYEILEGYNPDIDPASKSELLKAGCEFNGLTCLQLYQANLSDKSSNDEFVFTVSFRNPDGSIFELGPCCGATIEEMPPISQFEIHVKCSSENICQVLDLPPYVP